LGFLGRRFHREEKIWTSGQMCKWVVKPKLKEVPGLVPLNQALGSMMASSSIAVKSWNLGT